MLNPYDSYNPSTIFNCSTISGMDSQSMMFIKRAGVDILLKFSLFFFFNFSLFLFGDH